MISILLSTYKSNLDYLKQQICSILRQTEQDWELLIYNDGENNTKEYNDMMWKFVQDKRVQYYDHGHIGCVGSFNYLLSFAHGEYIAICDHDDIWETDKLEVEKKYLDEHPEVDCVFGWLRWFGEQNKLEKFRITDEEISHELNFYQPVKNPTAMFRKKRFGKMESPFDKASDFWYWSQYKDRHYHLIEKVLVNYRRHPGELTKDKTEFRNNSARVIRENMRESFGVDVTLDVCKMLDPYSATYNEALKQFIGGIIRENRILHR